MRLKRAPKRQLGFVKSKLDDAFFEPLPDAELDQMRSSMLARRAKVLLDTQSLVAVAFYMPVDLC